MLIQPLILAKNIASLIYKSPQRYLSLKIAFNTTIFFIFLYRTFSLVRLVDKLNHALARQILVNLLQCLEDFWSEFLQFVDFAHIMQISFFLFVFVILCRQNEPLVTLSKRLWYCVWCDIVFCVSL